MLQVIKYYMTYQGGLLLHLGVFAFVMLYASLFESVEAGVELTPFVTAGLIGSYWSIFRPMRKDQRGDTLRDTLPLSRIMLNMGKYISYYLFLVFYSVCFALYAVFTNQELLPVMGNLVNAFAFVYIFSSIIGKTRYLILKNRHVNIPDLIYVILAVIGVYFILNSPSPDHINLNGYIPYLDYLLRNLVVLLLFTSLDFVTMYLNRNKLVIG